MAYPRKFKYLTELNVHIDIKENDIDLHKKNHNTKIYKIYKFCILKTVKTFF